jgi:tRNA threonylcarbamoyladenosine biosynthesis protein TsaB
VLVLGIETATAQASVALGGPDGVISSFHLINKGRHAESLTPAIEFVCRQASKAISDITAIAVDNGPGLFTGLRVGLATAKAIAYARGIPALPVSSLEIIAHGARLTERKIVSIIDALSDEVYYATYFRGKELIAPALGSPGDVVAQLQDEVLLVGDGATRYAELFSSSRVEIAPRSFQYPNAASLVELAMSRDFANVPDVQIAYLRKPYVHTND